MVRLVAHDRILHKMAEGLERHSRLEFIPFLYADAAQFDRFFRADDAAWLHNTGRISDGSSLEDMLKTANAEDMLCYLSEHERGDGGKFHFLVRRAGEQEFLGTVGIVMRPNTRRADIGYFVLPSARRQGLAGEMARAVKDTFSELAPQFGVKRVVADVREDNEHSLRVLRSAGFTERGLQPSDFAQYRGQEMIRFQHDVAKKKSSAFER
jgi:RimJ/RimL family protein N-acetyltransferase